MYERPTPLIFGSRPSMTAVSHFIVVSSAHNGSCCGRPGISGMHFHPLVPCRMTRSVILWFPPLNVIPISTTVALSVIQGGPALSAFLIFHSSECCVLVKVPGGSGSVAVERSSANAVAGMKSMQTNANFECLDIVSPLLFSKRRRSFRTVVMLRQIARDALSVFVRVKVPRLLHAVRVQLHVAFIGIIEEAPDILDGDQFFDHVIVAIESEKGCIYRARRSKQK